MSRLLLVPALLVLLMATAPSALAQGGVTVRFQTTFHHATEGGANPIEVLLNVAPGREVTIPITVSHRGGATAADYSIVPASVTFASYEKAKSFSFQVASDSDADGGESVVLGFGTLPTGISALPNYDTALVKISDGGEVEARFISNAHHATEGGGTTISVSLNAFPGQEVTIPITVTHRGGATAADYSGVPSSVTFASDEAWQSFLFQAASDSDDDGESVELAFGTLPSGVSTGREGSTTVWINDGRAVLLGLAQVGTGITAVLSDGGATSNEAWQWQRAATETGAYEDIPAGERGTSNPYTPSEADLGMWLKAKVTYDAGSNTGRTAQGITSQPTMAQPVVSNAGYYHPFFIDYFIETFPAYKFAQGFTTGPDTRGYRLTGVRLALVGGAWPGGEWVGAWGVHADDGGKPAAQPLATALPILNSQLDEDPQTLVELRLPNGMSLDPNTKYWIVLARTSSWHEGLMGVGGLGDWNGTLPMGEGSDTPYADPGRKDGWSIDLQALTPDPGTSGWTTAADILELEDLLVLRMAVLVVPDVKVRYEADSYTVAEGGTQAVTVRLSADPQRTLTIPVTATGADGASAADYDLPASVTFNAGETSKTITFTATDDTEDDDGESVQLAFGTLPDIWVTEGSTAETTVSITDNDDPAVTVRFGAAAYTAAEGGSATVAVTLSAAPERSVVIPLTKTEQGGASSADYGGVPASVTFAAAETSKSFTFTATDDTVDDDSESVKLAFGTLPARVSAGTTATTTVSITDDDAPATVAASFGAATYAVTEGDDVTVTVSLDDDPEREVVIPLTKTDQGGASASDYAGVPASVTFDAGETAKTFTVSAPADHLRELGEQVLIGFGTLPSSATAGSPATTTVTISDSALSMSVPPTVHFSSSSYTAPEGGTATVTVTLSKAPGSDAVIPLTKTDQGGASAADYAGVPASLTFAAAETSKSFTFTATDDTVDDDGESVKLAFGTLPGGITATTGQADEATVSITDNDDPAVTVNFGAAAYTAAEGGSASVTVTLSAPPERSVVIPLTKTNQGGASSADYAGVPASVTFAAAETSKSFTFTATDDTVDDDGESVQLAFGILPARVTAGSTATTTVSITDDDDPAVTVRFGAAAYTAAEGGSATVTVTLSAAPERTVVIPLAKTDQGGASSADYGGVPASVTFAAAETSKSFTFTATDDTEDDDGESVQLAFGTLPARVSAGTTATTTVNITDDDDPAVTVRFGSSSYTAAEGGSATVTVTLSAAPERSVIIPLTKTNQGGASAPDYGGVPASLTFAAAETSKSLTFTATDDTVDDDGESVKLAFGTLPARVSAGTTATTTVSITDDDDPAVTVRFGSSSYTAAEGGSATVTVTLSAAPERTVVIPLTKTNQGGASAADYGGVPASLTFAAAETSKSFTFTATDDTVDDDGESVLLAFGTLPARVSAGTTATTTVSITDDDAPATVAASFGAAAYAVTEGDDVTVTVSLDDDPEREVVIPLTKTDQGGASASDYAGVPASVTFDAGETAKTFTVSAPADHLRELGEKVLIGFGTLPSSATAGSPATTTVTIIDSALSMSVPPTVHFSSSSYTAPEGGTATVTVTLSKAPGSDAVIPLTKTDQGGASAADYAGVPASVTFAAAETSKSFTFTATDDTVDDDGESVQLAFGTLPGGITATTGQADEATVSITDNDDPAVTVRFGAAAYTAAEGGSATVTVTLSAAPERSVVIPLTKTNQGGASAADYGGVPASLTFAAAETSKSFTFTATDDTVDDDGESVQLAFGTLPARVSAGSTATTTVSITDDDDPAVTVRFGSSSYTAAEGGSATVTVTLSAAPERSVIIPLTKTNQGGASAPDYAGVPASVTFAAAETSKSFTFTATDDTEDDDGESVQLAFGTLPARVSAGTTATTTVSITDDDDPAVTVRFGSSSYTAAEGGSATVTVTLSAAPERTVVIPLTKTNQGGASSADYGGVPASLTFAAAETSKSFTFTATDDTVDDDGESVLLAFGTLPARVSAGTTATTTVSITDDDAPATVAASFGAAAYAVTEGDDVTVTVSLDDDPEREVVIPLTKTDQGGASASDYAGVPASVTFDAGETAKTFTVSAPADHLRELGEKVLIGFGTLPSSATAGSPATTTVTIIDSALSMSVPPTVHFSSSSYTAPEGGTATVTVTLSKAPGSDAVIPLTKTDQGGASAADYAGVPASVTFAAAETSKSFTFTATDDTVDDDGESVQLAFGTLPGGITATTGQADEATVSITDNDDPAVTVRFGAAAYTAAEGGSATVTVTLSAAPERSVVIPLTKTNQGGASAADYAGVPASLTFAAAETSKSFTFTATDDTVDDDGESVQLAFGTLPARVSAGSTATTTVSITDDDDPAVTVRFGSSSYTAAEGGSATVTVTLSAAPERSVIIPLTKTNQGGASAPDYAGVPASVTFAAAETSKSFTFTATDDTEDDDGESVQLAFGTLPARVSAGTTATTTVSITDDDDPAVTVRFGSSSYTAAEGGSATVTVTLSAAPERTVVIPLTKTDQGGASAADYGGVPASLTFAAAETSKSFTFTATDDTVDDDGESVQLAFGTLPARVSAGTTATTTVSITDDDDPAVTVRFGSSSYTAAEGGSATVTVTLSAAPERSVVIPLTKTNQGGASSADYGGVPASLTFAAAETSKSFTFTATDDTVDDDGESVLLAFGTLPARVSAGTTATTTVSITDDDDPAVTVRFGSSSYTAAEGGSATVTVTLSAAPERSVVIPLTKTNQGGASAPDYGGVPASLTFAAAETSKSFTFTATDDTVDDDGESVQLAFGILPARVTAGSTAATTVSITDNDDPAVTVRFGAAAYTAAEGGSATVTVTLSAAPERSVVIPLTKTNQGGASAADYAGVPASLTFAAAETSKSFTFTATDDTEDDDGESVLLAFGTLPARVSAGTTATTTVSITNDVDCGTDHIWCGLLEFVPGQSSEVDVDLAKLDPDLDWLKPGPDDDFAHGGVVYQVFDVWMKSSSHATKGIQPPFRIPERAKLVFVLQIVGGDCVPAPAWMRSPWGCVWDQLPNEDQRDWALQVSTVKGGETLTVALPFSEASQVGDFPGWIWYGPDLEELRLAWSAGQIFKFQIDPDPRADRTPQRPGTPLYLEVKHRDRSGPWVYWVVPQRRDGGVPQDVRYRVQWKLATGDWDTPADVSEQTRAAGKNQGLLLHIQGLTAGAEYHIRVIAVNAVGAGPPSNVITYTHAAGAHAATAQAATAQAAPANAPATGAPTISGTARVDETLTAATAGIRDPDGRARAEFTYQWLANGVAIDGADGAGYTPVDADIGQALQVTAFFTDDAGYAEARTSAATAAVQAGAGLAVTGAAVAGAALTLTFNEILDDTRGGVPPAAAFTVHVGNAARAVSTVSVAGYRVTLTLAAAVAAGDAVTVAYAGRQGPAFLRDTRGRVAGPFTGQAVANHTAPPAPPALTASAHDVPTAHDGRASFTFELRFSEELAIGYVRLRDHAFTETGGAVVNARRREPGRNVRWEITVQPDGPGAVTLVLPVTVDCAAAAAICTADDRKLSQALTVTVAGPPANRPATGAPAISGTVQVGQTLTVAITDIADEDGLAHAGFSYRWLANDDEIAGAAGSHYTLAAGDQGKTIKVRVSFTDDAGHAEARTSPATAAVAARPNSPATGAPAISGTAQVGQTLTVSTNGIADVDGLDTATFTYQWTADDAAIQNAGNSTYTLVAADQGKTIQVRVSFTDDAGHAEARTSPATAAVAARPNSPATGAPAISGTAQVGQTLTVSTNGIADVDGLDTATFTYQWTADDAAIQNAGNSTYTLVAADQGKTIQVRVSFTDDAGHAEARTSPATAAVAARPNTPATGAPAISGTAQVGQTLTVSTNGIADVDGLDTATFTYQWTADDAAIQNAGNSTYTLVAADQGKTIQVRVSFTDDAGHAEARTSAATAAVAARPNSPATGAPAISGTAQVGQTLTVSTTGIADEDGLTGARFTYQWTADDDAIQNAGNSSYTLVAADQGKTIQVRVSFTDDAGHAEGRTSAATAAVAARPNTPATGAPAISGTAQVGQTLTAATTGIGDEDGLTGARFTYQWTADDDAIQNAGNSSYTLVAADQGKTIMVRVSFTDDAGHAEALTSPATATVAGLPLTTTASQAPGSHDGSASFTFELHFSVEPSLSYATLRDDAFTVTGGSVHNARRLTKGSNVGWEITVQPSGNGTVTIVLPPTTDCTAPGAVCTDDDRQLSHQTTVTVPGPDG